MSTAVSTIRSANPTGPLFTKTTKYEPLGLPRLSSQTSLLDVIRSQGHSMLQEPVRSSLCSEQQRKSKSLLPGVVTNSQPKSKPIRIVATESRHDEDTVEEDLLSSSAELERFYDQATWRMYILIQSARLASESAPGPSHGRVPTTSHSHAPYHPHSSAHHSSSQRPWTTQCPVEGSEEDAIFDFEL